MYETWETLEHDCLACHRCPLGDTRTHLVFGVGSRAARVLFVGEGPGENEDLQGEPFVGRGGKLLDQYLEAVGLDRTRNIYIANMVKCRPPKNRDPLPAEQEACLPWLREQVRFLKPRIIVCLGRISAQRLIDKNFRVTRQHGQFVEKNGVLMMGTYHPASLLRNPQQKPEAFEDFMALREKIREICPETYADLPPETSDGI